MKTMIDDLKKAILALSPRALAWFTKTRGVVRLIPLMIVDELVRGELIRPAGGGDSCFTMTGAAEAALDELVRPCSGGDSCFTMTGAAEVALDDRMAERTRRSVVC